MGSIAGAIEMNTENWLFGAAMIALVVTETILFVDRQMSSSHMEVHYQVRVDDTPDPVIDTLYLIPIEDAGS
jgi:hypothetical protein